MRDTFLNTGWERYRDPAIRNTAGRILNRLADQEEVTADDADESMDMLLDMNLNPSVGLTLRNVETEEEEVPS
ncbi:MAG: hypothetical protein H8E44_22540 [Planctomycetes bacterium]|nr:hypothetical protein [Planctomycetota bacterium]